ncbi:MAG: hypothetical protein JWQ98_3502 [Chlorobi bacterium]|nr:hypothetical protein [Chlorobiota bacterium]
MIDIALLIVFAAIVVASWKLYGRLHRGRQTAIRRKQ